MGGKQKLNSFEELASVTTKNTEDGVSYTSTVPEGEGNATQNQPKDIQSSPEDGFSAIQQEKKRKETTKQTPKENVLEKKEEGGVKNSQPEYKKPLPPKTIYPRKNVGKKALAVAHAGPESSFKGEGTSKTPYAERTNNNKPVKVISVARDTTQQEFFASNPKKNKEITMGFAKIPTNERAVAQRKSKKNLELSSPYEESLEAKKYFANKSKERDTVLQSNKLIAAAFPQISHEELTALDEKHKKNLERREEKKMLQEAEKIVHAVEEKSIQKPQTPNTKELLVWPKKPLHPASNDYSQMIAQEDAIRNSNKKGEFGTIDKRELGVFDDLSEKNNLADTGESQISKHDNLTNPDKSKTQKSSDTKESNVLTSTENPKENTNKKTIADFLFKKLTGKETFAVHGTQEKSGDVRPQTDLDGKLSVFLADYFGIKWNNTQFVAPGEAPQDTAVVFDSGYKKSATVELNGTQFQIFFDHHSKEKAVPTSAANELLKTIEHAKKHKEIPEWVRKFVYFTTEIDNFSYFERKDRLGNNIFTSDFASKTWPKTLYALYRFLPFSFIKDRFEKGISPLSPFKDEELSISVRTPQGGTATLKELIERVDKSTKYSINIVKKTSKKMYESYILDENKELGKLLFVETKADEKGKVSGQVQVKEVANMLGYDTLIQYSKDTGNIYISSQKDLNTIEEKLKKIGNLIGPIRGQQAFGKTDTTKEEILKLLEIDDSPEKRIERFTEEKRRLEEELKNMGTI